MLPARGVPFRSHAGPRAGCAAPARCARSSARRGSTSTTSSCRSSSARTREPNEGAARDGALVGRRARRARSSALAAARRQGACSCSASPTRRTTRARAPGTTTGSSSARCARCARACPSSCCSPTSACASTPRTATAASGRRARRGRQRRDARAARPDGGLPRRGRRRRGLPERHDGRPRRARSARRCRETPIVAYAAKYASAFYGPFREAAELGAVVRRPARLPDGSGERARGAARVRARRRRGRGHDDGQAGAAVPRRDPRGARALRPARSPPTTSPASTRWSRPPRPQGWLDERQAALESLTAIRRAGADLDRHVLDEGPRRVALSDALGRSTGARSS